MTKLFKNYILNFFIVVAFFLSQIVNVHANHLSTNSQREDVSVIEQTKKKAIYTAALYFPSLKYGVEHETPVEGKFEKVLEPVSIGIFGLGVAIGYASTAVGLFFGWLISIIRAAIKQ
ncbi:hypothetical protein ACRPOS_001615 [Bartonella heixiaziensis]|uniref:hypothetical protein n=1 Tax=Bartonella heixiaziensis TaxID=1461000 RepID=UPI0039089C66